MKNILKSKLVFVILIAISFAQYANAIVIKPHENDKTFLELTCDSVIANGNTWTLSGTWTAYNFGGQSTQYDVGVSSPANTYIDESSKDNPDTFVIVNGVSDYADDATPPKKDDMDGTWSNQVIFGSTPSSISAALYHGKTGGNEISADATCSFTLPPQCSNGIDDDSDGLIDYPADPGCTDANDNTESPNPVTTATLTLQKEVMNDDGGNAVDTDWTLAASGPTNISGVEGSANVTNAVVTAGQYTLSENGGPAGYLASLYSCVKNNGNPAVSNTITLAGGDSAVCTVTNDDIAPKLTVIKYVTNNNGGTLEVSDFPLFIDETSVTSGVANELTPGNYVVSEISDSNYTASSWGGNCDANGNVTLALGDDKTCTITNDDKPAQLTVIKDVINDNGGLLEAIDFIMNVLGIDVSNSSFQGSESGVTVTLDAGGYSVDEVEDGSYAKSLGESCSGEIGIGEEVTCTITNDDIAPKLKVTKIVINENGGTLEVSDFTLYVDGEEVESGVYNEFDAGEYTVSEDNQPGYVGVFSGACNEYGEVTLELGDEKECIITNTDIAPGITLIKSVTNNNGGEAVADDFQAYINGDPVSWNQAQELEAGTYELSEDLLTGYDNGDWSCEGGSQDGNMITLEVGETVVCSVVNDDIAPSLTIVKEVVNNDGGNAVAEDWFLTASGPTSISGNGGASSDENFSTGSYELSETTGPSGYTPGDWVCEGGEQSGNSITLGLGESATCTITNDDQPGTLIVKKIVSGGEKVADDFSFSVNDNEPESFDEDGQNELTVPAGWYSVSEPTDPNYEASYDNCSEIEIVNGGEAMCVITNTFIPTPVPGCTDPDASNYNSGATVDDQSCEYVIDMCPNIKGVQEEVPNGYKLSPSGNNCIEESSGGSGGGSAPQGGGEVLGAETTELCSWDVNTYMRKGYKGNVPSQVTILQRDLLNGFMNAGLTVDGVYGPKTEEAVKAFQMFKKDKILTPWGIINPTGIFYKTTLVEAKNTICPEVILPIPTDLVNWSQVLGR